MDLPLNAAKRRAITVPVVVATALLLTVTIPLWLPLALLVDVVRARLRLPLARLLAFGLCWAWLETAGVAIAFGLAVIGQGRNQRLLFALQRWWARQLVTSLRATCRVTVEIENVDAFTPGPVLLFVRHASLADALVSAYVTTNAAHMNPRFVLKRELLSDPCLDIVGHRIPNHFLDRTATDSAPELAALEQLVVGMDTETVAVIFPEGTRANPAKRTNAIAKIAERDPARAEKLRGLRHLLPPRPSGAMAMVRGAKEVDVVLAWHVGCEGLDTFAGIIRGLSRSFDPIRFVARRVPSAEVPADETFTDWLDDQWLRMDEEVDAALVEREGRRH